MVQKVITLTELIKYRDAGLSIQEIIDRVNNDHGVVKVFDHSPPAMGGMRFRYYVMPLKENGDPVTKLAKGVNLQ